MKKIIVLIGCLLIAGAMAIHAQSVGIGIGTPDNSALLHLNSGTKGFLLPSMSTSQRVAIAAPAEGLLLHDFNTKSVWFRTSASWTEIVTRSSNLWQENGADIYRSTGNVGIGVTNALNRLHVHNSLGTTNFLRVTNNGSGALATDGLILGAVNNNASLVNNENGYLVIGTNNDSLLFLTSVFGGVPRLGIGESFPGATIDVKSASNNVAKFNGANQMYLSFYENSFPRGYIGSYCGSSSDVDFGTTGDDPNAKLHLAINFVPRLTVNDKGNVGIGTIAPVNSARLHVAGDSVNTLYLTSTHNSATTSAILKTETLGGISELTATGIEIAHNGTQGRGRGLLINSGYIGAEVYSADASFANQNYGVIASASSDNDCWGLYGVAGGSGFGATKIGVFGSASGGGSNWAFYGNGNAFLVGGMWQTSDERFKQNISTISDASSKLLRLVPRQYHFDTSAYRFLTLPSELQQGFLASNMREVFPELVKKVTMYKDRPIPGSQNESVEFNSVNYTGLIPVITQAVNEHTEEIKSLKLLLEEYRVLLLQQQKLIEQLKAK